MLVADDSNWSPDQLAQEADDSDLNHVVVSNTLCQQKLSIYCRTIKCCQYVVPVSMFIFAVFVSAFDNSAHASASKNSCLFLMAIAVKVLITILNYFTFWNTVINYACFVFMSMRLWT